MKILVITPYFYPHSGGSQQYIEGLYTALKKIQPDLEVDVLCYNTDHQSATDTQGIFSIYRVPCLQILQGQFAIPNYFALHSLLNKLKKSSKKYDFVNAHTRFFESSWWAPLVAKTFNAKSIFTDHCASSPWHPNVVIRFIAKSVDRFITPLIARNYNTVTVVSQATQHYLESLGVKVDQVITCGIENEEQQVSKNQPKSTITIGFVGRMISSKHPEIVFEVIKKLTNEGKHIKGLFVGGGALLTELQSRQTNQIKFTGALSHQETQVALSKIDILLHPSVHHEGLPMVLLEAGKAGCAVITSPQGGSTEVVVNGKTGLLAQPTVEDFYSATKRLMSNPVEIKKYGQALQRKVSTEFNWDDIAKKYSVLLE